MGTTYHVTLADTTFPVVKQVRLKQAVDSLLAEINNVFSTYIPESEISRFNRAPAGVPFPISKELHTVLVASLRLNRLSGGAFDITVMPLVNAYGFGFRPAPDTIPRGRQLDSLKALVGCDHLQLTDTTLLKDKLGVMIDLSANAKGYGVDRVAEFLARRGFKNFMVEIGGEVVVRGTKGGRLWRIGINRPVNELDSSQLQHILKLQDIAVATSGDYHNYRNVQGKWISHTIDPRTGKPVPLSLASVTVIAPTCLEADGLATAIMVLGPTAGLSLLERLPKVEGLLIQHQGHNKFREIMTSGFRRYLAE